MEIFDNLPNDWKDLQNKVAYVLEYSGFRVEILKKIESVRSNIEIDVYAENQDLSILCECKYWDRNVSQNTVFSFRTIIGDVGANKGLIITKSGFQSGAYKSSKKTNVELYTWEEFLKLYKDRYLKCCLKKYLIYHSVLFRIADDKEEYLKYYIGLNQQEQTAVNQLKNRLMIIVLQMSPMINMIRFEQWDIDYCDQLIKEAGQKYLKVFSCYYDYFEFVKYEIEDIILQINNLCGIEILNVTSNL